MLQIIVYNRWYMPICGPSDTRVNVNRLYGPQAAQGTVLLPAFWWSLCQV